MSNKTIWDEAKTTEVISDLTQQIETVIANSDVPVILIGVQTGGAWLAQHIAPRVSQKPVVATLDISFYRDDFGSIGLNPDIKPSRMPITLANHGVILIDDVIYTGRTIRAALNEVFDFGRPAWVRLATLIDRPARELPIHPDICGQRLEVADDLRLKLVGPENLHLEQVSA